MNEKLMKILQERYPDYIEFNKLAAELNMLPDELTKYLNENKDKFIDIEIKTSWDGKKMIRLNL